MKYALSHLLPAAMAHAVLMAAPARGAEGPLPTGLVNAIPVQVAGPEEELAALSTHLEEMLEQQITLPVQVVRVSAADAASAVRKDITGEDRPAAWVLIERGRARVRVAGAGRSRFVFRALAVSRPMSELDRERTGHALQTALTAVIEDQPARNERGQADLAPVPLLPEPEPEPEPQTVPVRAAEIAAADRILPPSPSAGPPGWMPAVSYEAQRLTICRCGGAPVPAALHQSVGMALSKDFDQGGGPYELLLGGRLHLPMTVQRGFEFRVTGLSLHFGTSMPITRAINVGLGVGGAAFQIARAPVQGLERDTPDYAVLALARAFARFGPHALGSLSLSALAFLEVAHQGARWQGGDRDILYEDSRLRPGLGLEARWR